MSEYLFQNATEPKLVTHHPRALRKMDYEDRPAPHDLKRNNAGNLRGNPSPTTLPLCPKCEGGTHRTTSGYIRPEDIACNCDCGFLVSRHVAANACDFPPGSPEKMAVISARYRLGINPYHPRDRREQFPGRLVEMVIDQADDIGWEDDDEDGE